MPNIFILANYKEAPWYVQEMAKQLDAYICTAGYPPAKARQPDDIVINWGVGRFPVWDLSYLHVVNNPSSVRNSVHKERMLRVFEAYAIPTVSWTTDFRVARSWLDDGHTIFSRGITTGCDGEGINVVFPSQEVYTEFKDTLPVCPLYTKKVECDVEFRVHVFYGKVIDVLQKKRKKGKTINKNVRTTNGGWVHCRYDILDVPEIQPIAIEAAKSLGLSFAGVDIGVKFKKGSTKPEYVVVFETNTAPELEPTTMASYINAFKSLPNMFTQTTTNKLDGGYPNGFDASYAEPPTFIATKHVKTAFFTADKINKETNQPEYLVKLKPTEDF